MPPHSFHHHFFQTLAPFGKWSKSILSSINPAIFRRVGYGT